MSGLRYLSNCITVSPSADRPKSSYLLQMACRQVGSVTRPRQYRDMNYIIQHPYGLLFIVVFPPIKITALGTPKQRYYNLTGNIWWCDVSFAVSSHCSPLTPYNVCWHRLWSTSAPVMAWCPTAPSHYRSHCWLIINPFCDIHMGAISQKISMINYTLKSVSKCQYGTVYDHLMLHMGSTPQEPGTVFVLLCTVVWFCTSRFLSASCTSGDEVIIWLTRYQWNIHKDIG